MTSVNLYYDGTLKDLKEHVDDLIIMFGRNNSYKPEINKIRKDIYKNFNKYKDYSLVVVGKVKIYNRNAKISTFYLDSTEEELKPQNAPLYSWECSIFLLYILLFLIVIFLFVALYSYIYEIPIWTYSYNSFLLF